ncbi:hypothetical protein QFC22_003204 [Naganishia vaughanmartiniae]|uniref:Uncharacterized protein n=1 Tax=Naganishia vaughanmartiniae TaxID=1424756 RepID=A0ACC2X748_9TREE|nr:hypothetical protein QFC22_003204 [Naganishia vaughanmartiniae]
MTDQQAIILSQLFPEEWALLHPIYGGQGVTALSLRSLPSPESLPISPPGEEFVKLDLDACRQLDGGVVGGEKEGGLPSIKDVLGDNFQWMNWNQIVTTVMTPPPFSPGPTHSANDDEGITLPPIRHSSSFSNDHFSNEHDNHDNHGNGAKSASNSPADHQFSTEQLSSVKTIVYYPASPPSKQQQQLLTNNAHRHDGRLPPPLRALCIPPPPLDLGKINYTQPQDQDRLSPLMAISQKRYHPYQLSPVHHSPLSAAGSRTSRAAGSWTTEGGITSPASADGMNIGFNMLDIQEEGRGVKDGSRLAERGGNMIARGRRVQHALPAGRLVAPPVVVAPIRPPYTFTVLITYALVGSPQKKLTLSQVSTVGPSSRSAPLQD